MSSPINPDNGNKPKRPLPPELAFLTDTSHLKMDAEEMVAHIKRQHELIRQHAALIREHGMDPDVLISFTAKSVKDLENACAKSDEADLKLFHSIADKAEAEYRLFKETEAIAEKQYAERPFDNDAQELKEFVDEWRKQMPKE